MKYFLVSISYVVLKQKYAETYIINALSMAEAEMKIEIFFSNKGIPIKISRASVSNYEEVRTDSLDQAFHTRSYFEEMLESGKKKRHYSNVLFGAPDYETAYNKTKEYCKSASIDMFIHTIQEKAIILEEELLSDSTIQRIAFNEKEANRKEQIANGGDIDKEEM